MPPPNPNHENELPEALHETIIDETVEYTKRVFSIQKISV